MPDTNISSADTSDFANYQTDYSVDSKSLDSPQDQKETYYTIENWGQWLGYYKTIPELAESVDAKARWTVGKGYTADKQTTKLLDAIKGIGKDTFNTIIENLDRTRYIAGDSFAEIILDENRILINLKPLDPGSIRIVANKQGLIIRYEQINRAKKEVKIFKPEEIFHLSRNRIGDEIHGTSIIPVLENVILARNESVADWKKVLHRNIAPVIIWHMDTDDPVKIAEFKAKREGMKNNMEEIYIPKGAVVPEVLAVAPNATMNALPWIDYLTNFFYQITGVPDIILGGSKSFTEASAKISYLAFQQTVEEDQLYIEEQVLSQLNLQINLEFPASLESEALSDKPKMIEEPQANIPEVKKEKAAEPNDLTIDIEGRK